jgi:hypothetical protein
VETTADIVDQDVDRAEFTGHSGHERLDRLGVAHVEHVGECPTAHRFDRVGGFGEPIGLTITDRNVGAERRKRECRCLADALGGAGHDRDSVGEHQLVGGDRHETSSWRTDAPTLRECPFPLERPSSWVAPRSSTPNPISTTPPTRSS